MITKYARICAVVVTALVLSSCGRDHWPHPPKPGPTTTTSTTLPPGEDSPLTSRDLPTTQGPAVDLPGYNVTHPTNLDATGSPLPVLVWGNGGCFRHDATWQPLFDRWASAGFVVISMTTPPSGNPLEQHDVEDQRAGIDWAEQQNAAVGGPFAGHLDLDRVVAAGNSCGGITALGLASTDDRVASVYVLSGSAAFPGAPPEDAERVISSITVPIGYVTGGPEDISRANVQQDFGFAEVPAYIANRASGDHVAVSTDPGMLVEHADIALNWLDLTLYGNESARTALLSNPCATAGCAPDLWTVQSKNL